jgi:hypothetical protein
MKAYGSENVRKLDTVQEDAVTERYVTRDRDRASRRFATLHNQIKNVAHFRFLCSLTVHYLPICSLCFLLS